MRVVILCAFKFVCATRLASMKHSTAYELSMEHITYQMFECSSHKYIKSQINCVCHEISGLWSTGLRNHST